MTRIALPPELRDLIGSGPLAHLTTINADGSPQVTVIWIGLDGDDIVSGHLGKYAKVRNMERDPDDGHLGAAVGVDGGQVRERPGTDEVPKFRWQSDPSPVSYTHLRAHETD